MKQQVRNKLHGKAGFTLVELIVVIAILGILAGIGTVGYSGYVKRANMSADQQLVSNIRYAIELAYASDPTFNGTEAIVLREGATAQIISGSAEVNETSWLTTAVNNAFGSNALESMKLKYGKWGKGAAVAQETLRYFKNVVDTNSDAGLAAVYSGTAVPSFADDVDDLFTTIRDTAIKVNGGLGGTTGAELIQDAAELTVAKSTSLSTAEFANAWANSAWSDALMGEGESYDSDIIHQAQGDATKANFMANAVANAGVVKARNTALACYLREEGFGETYSLFADYGTGIIPKDIVGMMLEGVDENSPEEREVEAFEESLIQALGSEERVDDMIGVIYSYYTPDGDDGTSQAYKDGLAYYAMMNTINGVNNSEGEIASDDAYWDEMAGAVSLYGSIARGETNLDELNRMYTALGDVNEANAVVVAAMSNNGKLTVSASPATVLGS